MENDIGMDPSYR